MTSTIDLVTLSDLKTFLNMSATNNDAQLSSMITAASTMWVNRVGPVAGSPVFSERYDGGVPTIHLKNTPVQSVTTVTEVYFNTTNTLTLHQPDDVSAFSALNYSIDLTTGLLTRRNYGIVTNFADGVQNIHVTYVAGYSSTPEDVKHAVLLLVQHMWETQRGRMVMPNQRADADSWNPAFGFTWPRRVEEIAQSYYTPGLA
jgi:uncharacterized phiE125 gp8 family phage protein